MYTGMKKRLRALLFNPYNSNIHRISRNTPSSRGRQALKIVVTVDVPVQRRTRRSAASQGSYETGTYMSVLSCGEFRMYRLQVVS